MAASTRWVSYDLDAVGSATEGTVGGVGTKGYSFGKGTVTSGINIGPTTNRLYVAMDGLDEAVDPVTLGAGYVTLTSGTGLDPRFVARDITEKLHAAGSNERWTHATCLWEDCYEEDAPNNYDAYTAFKIYSGTRGSSSSVTVASSGTNSAHVVLGFTSGNIVSQGGTNQNLRGGTNTFNGTISISGTYYGFFDEEYMIVITNDDPHTATTTRGIDHSSLTHTAGSYAGTVTLGGIYNGATDRKYLITVDVTNGTTMGAGRGNVPRMRWTVDTGTADDMKSAPPQWIELLYPDHWYSLGTKGVQVKFSDAVFSGDTWTVQCYKADYAQGTNGNSPVGTARMVWTSTRGDYIDSHVATPASGTWTALGSKGLYVSFGGFTNNLYAGDEFRVTCAGPHPGAQANYDISSLNFGNVTVSTDSDVKAVMFEIIGGAEELSTVKFGLQNHGSFNHHNTGNNDTRFRFGTVGPDNVKNGYEWYPSIVYTDISGDAPPAYLYAVDKNLSVVSTADASESVGNTGLTSDPIWVSVQLGSSETGSNSTINYRLYFDYS